MENLHVTTPGLLLFSLLVTEMIIQIYIYIYVCEIACVMNCKEIFLSVERKNQSSF